jgi:hypothetical protein
MASTSRSRLLSRLLVGGLTTLLAGVGCGGSTDIGFQGYDAGVAGTGNTGTGGTGAVGTGGTGAVGTGGTGGVGTGGTGTGGTGVTGGAGGVPAGGSAGTGTGGTGGVVCGGQVCTGTNIPGIGQADPCCSSNNKCGLTNPALGGQCAEKNQAGKVDPNCPPLNQGGFQLAGCCKPDNHCGYMDTFIGLGCVDPSQFGAPSTGTCNYNGGSGGTGGSSGAGGSGGSAGSGGTGGSGGSAGVSCGSTTCTGGDKCCAVEPAPGYCTATSNQCTCTGSNCTTTDVQCDGPEDCPGQMCCGVFSVQLNRYTRTECRNSCASGGGTIRREMCHPGQTCTDSTQTCGQSQGLPSGYNLYRCN